MDTLESRVKKDNVAIVLVEPQIPENIGAAARAMHNMDLHRLILVNPKNPDQDRILKLATAHSADVIDRMEVYEDLQEALGLFQFIAGTTARTGTARPTLKNPRSLAQELIEVSQENSVAILFGPEDRGLSNDQLRYCHTITTIPTSSFSSLNLAQAVLVISYEIFLASGEWQSENTPRLANSFELEGMYGHLKEVLTKIGFLNPQNPEHWMLFIRRMFSRMGMRSKEVRTLRGICRQIDWYTDQIEKKQKLEDNGDHPDK
ncbi:MAG: RNA methyltransferase [Deltaproteobacteria bacterium]|nr:RNA methyltransferase [Deltaproteobacteria bacterium]